MRSLLQKKVFNTSRLNIASWAQIQQLVRKGEASRYIKIGDRFSVEFNGIYTPWVVIGIDHDIPTDSQYKHSLTLQSCYCLSSGKAMSPDAMFYTGSNVAAGVKVFLLNSTKYTLTTGTTIPGAANGQIVITNWSGNTPTKAAIYPNPGSTTALQSNINIATSSGTENLSPTNNIYRCLYGNNRPNNIIISRWLMDNTNSFLPAYNQYCRVLPEAPYTGAGFLYLLETGLVEVLGNVNKPSLIPSVDGGGQIVIPTPCFLLSSVEVGGVAEGTTTGEKTYAYYIRNPQYVIKNDINGTLSNWWLRSAYFSDPSKLRYVTTIGAISTQYPNSSYGISPAVCIV